MIMDENLVWIAIFSNIALSIVALFVSFKDRRMFMDYNAKKGDELRLVCESIKEVVLKMGMHTHQIEVRPDVGFEAGNPEPVVVGSSERIEA